MTNTDPKDPAAWAEATRIAEAQGVGAVVRHSPALPFLFEAERRSRCVLIHKGAVITARGPETAGAYLRDLQVLRGAGPGIEDVLWTLWALEALPQVAPLAPESYVHEPGVPRFEELTARLEYDGNAARVVLHYLVPPADGPPAPASPGSGAATSGSGAATPGSVLRDWRPPPVRRVLRLTLDIPERGPAAWRREDLNWVDPG